MSMNFLSQGMGYGNPRQDTMRSMPAPVQNAPAITAGTSLVKPTGVVTKSGNVAAQGGFGVSGFGNDSLVYGRMSLGFVASLVVLLALAYMWTRNVQGGG